MMGATEEQRLLELEAWVEDATAVIVSNLEARAVRAELISHYQEHRMMLEADGWSAPEAHQTALAQLGSPQDAQRTWVQRMGLAEALPWTLGALAIGLQLSGVAGWPLGLYLSWIVAGTAVVLGGRRLWRIATSLAAYWRAQWVKLSVPLILAGGLIGLAIGFEPVWAGQPIWGGHALDSLIFWWKIPVMLVTLAFLGAVAWRGVYQARTAAWAASGQVGGGALVGLVLGSGLGLAATCTWLVHHVVPASPGHTGYLPHWPWQAVSYSLSEHMVPAVVILSVWVIGVAMAAGQSRQHRLQASRQIAPEPSP